MNFIFTDLETNGIDPHKPDALILEIALVAVDQTLTEVAHWHSPIIPSRGDWFSTLPPELVEMHSNSGLLGELRGSRAMMRFEAGGLPTLDQAQLVALQFMQQFGTPPDKRGGTCTMAGANPAFDLGWVRVHMPELAQRFHYRVYDTNALWVSQQWLAGQTPAKTAVRHRALDDARQSVQTVRTFFGMG